MKRRIIRFGLGCALLLYSGSFGAIELFLVWWARQSVGHPDIAARGGFLAFWFFQMALGTLAGILSAFGWVLHRKRPSAWLMAVLPFAIAVCLFGSVSAGGERLLLLPLRLVSGIAGGAGLWICYTALFLWGVWLFRPASGMENDGLTPADH